MAVPTRERVGDYERIRERIERLVGQINGRFARLGRVPVHYLYRSLPVEELMSYYLAADVMLVTPLRDGNEHGGAGILRRPSATTAACWSYPNSPAPPTTCRTRCR